LEFVPQTSISGTLLAYGPLKEEVVAALVVVRTVVVEASLAHDDPEPENL